MPGRRLPRLTAPRARIRCRRATLTGTAQRTRERPMSRTTAPFATWYYPLP